RAHTESARRLALPPPATHRSNCQEVVSPGSQSAPQAAARRAMPKHPRAVISRSGQDRKQKARVLKPEWSSDHLNLGLHRSAGLNRLKDRNDVSRRHTKPVEAGYQRFKRG